MLAAIRTFFWKFAHLGRRSHSEASFDEELRFHIEMETEANVRVGMTPEEAHRRAMLALGGVEQAKEERREGRAVMFLETTRQDFAYAARRLTCSPGFSILVVLTLAIGIAATTAIFSAVNGILLRPLPIPKPGQVVRIYEENPRAGQIETPASPDNFIDWRSRTKTFDGMATFWWRKYNLIGNEQTETIQAMHVTSDFFRVLGVQPAIGRAFLPEEYPPATSAPNVQVLPKNAVFMRAQAPPKNVVLSYGLWQRAFGGTLDVVGRTLRLGENDVTVVGVMPSHFSIGELLRNEYTSEGPDCFMPDTTYQRGRRARYLSVLARVKDGVTVKQAEADMKAVAGQLEREYPKENSGWGPKLVSLHHSAVNAVRPQIRLLAGAVAFLLLIACANVANLLLLRTAGRRRELAARAALGATRARLVRQLLTETLVVSVLACLVSLVLAEGAIHALVRLAPARLPRLNEIGLDRASFLFAVAVSFLTGTLCGLVPALRSPMTDVGIALKDEGPATPGRLRRSFSRTMVVVETALALVLLIAAGLLARTFLKLNAVPLGFQPDHVLTVGFNISPGTPSFDMSRSFYRDLLSRVQKLPSVQAAAIGQSPFSLGLGTSLSPEGATGERINSPAVVASPDYFRTLSIRLVSGRFFELSDTAENQAIAIISQSLAARLWPGQNPLGRRLTTDDPTRSPNVTWLTVVGVVADVRNAGLEREWEGVVYLPLDQTRSLDPNNLLVRTSGDAIAIVPTLRSVVRSLDRDRALTRVETMEEHLATMLAPRRFTLFVIAVFSVLAFSFALVGIYGVVAQTVTRRTREIAIRSALGADRAGILRLMMRETSTPIIIGDAIGLVLAFALNHVMKTLVFGITTTDAFTYATIATCWAATAMLACFIPARRATRLDPLVALRHE